jgi:hypothetical protein
MPAYRSPYEVGSSRPVACAQPPPRTVALALRTAHGRRAMAYGTLGAPGRGLPQRNGAFA